MSSQPTVTNPNNQITDNADSFVTLDEFLKTGTAYNLLNYASLPTDKQNYIKQQIINFLYVASQQLNSVSGGKIAPVWKYLQTLPEANLTPLQKADINYVTNAVIKWVDYLIYTQGIFADVNIDAPANLPFSLTGKSSNADVENVRRDVIQMLNNTSFYNTLTTYEDKYSDLFTKGCIESIKYISDEALKVIQDWCNTQFYPSVPFRKDVDLLNTYDLLNPRNIFSATATDKQNVPNVSKISGFDINVTSNSINFIDDNVVVPNQTWSSQKINTFLGDTTNFATQSWVNEQLTPIKENINGFAEQLPDYQKKLVAGQNIVIDPTTNIISASIQGQEDLASKVWVGEQLEPLNTKITTNTNAITTLRNDQEALGDTVNENTNAIDKINTTTLPLYQKKLIAGNNITIDETTNTISSSGGGSGSDLLIQPNTWTQNQTFKGGAFIGGLSVENGNIVYTNPVMKASYLTADTTLFNNKTLGGGMLALGLLDNTTMQPYNIPNIMIRSSGLSDPYMSMSFNNIEPFNINAIKLPTSAGEIANKQYVDLQIANLPTPPTPPNLLVLNNLWTGTQTLNNANQLNTTTDNFNIAIQTQTGGSCSLVKEWNGSGFRNYLYFNMVYKNTTNNTSQTAFQIISTPNSVQLASPTSTPISITDLSSSVVPLIFATPTASNQGATKGYVDTAISNITPSLPVDNYYIRTVNGYQPSFGSLTATNTVIHFDINNLSYNPTPLYLNYANGTSTMGIKENGIYVMTVTFWTNNSTVNLASITAQSTSGNNLEFIWNAKKNTGNGYQPPIGSAIFSTWKFKVSNASANNPVNIALVLERNVATIGGFEIQKVAELGAY